MPLASKKRAVRAPVMEATAHAKEAVARPIPKAVTGKRTSKNCPAVIAAAAPAAPSVLSSAPTLSEKTQDDVTVLRGKLVNFLVLIINLTFFSLALLTTARNDLKIAQEAAASNTKELPPIECPKNFKVSKLKGELNLGNNDSLYAGFTVSFLYKFLSNVLCSLNYVNCSLISGTLPPL